MRRVAGILLFLGVVILFVERGEVAGQTKDAPGKEKETSPSKDMPAKDAKASETKYDWPKEILGKNLEAWVKDMKDHPDPSMREMAVRTIPLFGPDVRKVASANLLYVLAKDRDYSVRMSALGIVPTIGFEDKEVKPGIAAILEMMRSTQFQTRHDAIVTLGNCGPIARDAIPTIIGFGLKDPTSWQIRRVSANALAQIGAGVAEDGGPDNAAMLALIERLQLEPAVQARREIVQALLVLGLPNDKQTWVNLRRALEAHKKDADKSTAIWSRLCLMRTEEKKVTEKDTNVREFVGFLKSSDPAIRTETLQAIGQMGSELSFLIPDIKSIVETDKDVAAAGTAVWALTTMTTHAQEILQYLNQIKKTHQIEAVRKTAEEAIKWMTEIKKEEPPKKDPKKEAVPKK